MALDEADRNAIVEAITAGFSASNRSSFSSSPSGNRSGGNGVDVLGAGAGLLGRAFKDSAGIIARGGGRLADSIKNTSGALSSIIGYVENTNDVFRSLSKVGAGFDAELGTLRSSAALTRMPLEQFANMVGSNAQALSGFSGGVNAGAKQFSRLSNSMFESGLIDQFTSLGFSIEESNEFILKNMQLDRRRARMTNMSEAAQVESALQLAKSMDVMAKLTGKSVQEQQDSMTAKMRDGATQARIRLLEMDGITGASDAYKKSQAALEGAPKVVGDLLADLTQTGVPMTEATKNFAATNREAYSLLQQSANATKRGDVANAERLAQQAAAATAAYANSRQGLELATLAQANTVAQGQADRLEDMTDLIDQIGAHQQQMSNATGRTVGAMEAYANMLETAVDTQTIQSAGNVNAQQAASNSINQGQIALANAASEVNVEIGKALGGPGAATVLEGLEQAVKDLSDLLGDGGALAVNMLGGVNYGDAAGILPPGQNRTDLETIDDPNASAEDKQAATARLIQSGTFNSDGSLNVVLIEDLTSSKFDSVKEEARRQADEDPSGPSWFTRIYDSVTGTTEDRAIGGSVQSGQSYRVGELGPETFVAGMDGAIIPNMKAMLNRIPDIAKTMQDEMTQFGTPMSEAMKSASAQMQGNNSLEQKLDILNQTMLQLVSINSTQARTGEKHLRATRGVGNFMTGIGKA